MHSAIFSGQVRHARKTPKHHAFNYRVFMMLIDLSELDTVFQKRWFWSTRRPALARFRRENYYGDPKVPLANCIRALVRERTGAPAEGPIRLLTNLSYFGFCFNPISLYYCFQSDGETIDAIVAEVSNTPWGERHCYVLPANENTGDHKTHRYIADKTLHVSPFMEMNFTYDWLITRPAGRLLVRLKNMRDGEVCFTATLDLERREISSASLAATLVRFPFMTYRTILGIHWQAARLWLKGCPIYPHPKKKNQLQADQ